MQLLTLDPAVPWGAPSLLADVVPAAQPAPVLQPAHLAPAPALAGSGGM